MYWNHRIIYHDDIERPYYGVHEVFYDDENQVETYTTEPVGIEVDSPEEVFTVLKQMFKDCKKQSVLKASEITANIEAHEAAMAQELERGEFTQFDSVDALLKHLVSGDAANDSDE